LLSSEKLILDFERKAIAILSPPAQQASDRNIRLSHRQRMPRPWPRFRDRTLYPAKEVAGNLHFNNFAFREHRIQGIDVWQWLHGMFLFRHLGPAQILRVAYVQGREHWLCMLWTLPVFHFSWKLIWRRPKPLQYICRIWCAATRLPPKLRTSLRRSIERLGASCDWFPSKHTWIDIPSNASHSVWVLRRWLNRCFVFSEPDPHIRRFWISRIYLRQLRGPNVADRIDHRKTAFLCRASAMDDLVHIHKVGKIHIQKLPQHWSAFDVENPEDLVSGILNVLSTTRSFHTGALACFVDNVDSIIAQIGSHPLAHHRPGLDIFADPPPDHIFVPLDRDIKHRPCLHRLTYEHLVLRVFCRTRSTTVFLRGLLTTSFIGMRQNVRSSSPAPLVVAKFGLTPSELPKGLYTFELDKGI
jgi:hypothetical protein